MNTVHRAYTALGLEPGASALEVTARYKDLIMAWHPDRFTKESQKKKAEEELKRINESRDRLRQHFQTEHTSSPDCPCRPAPARIIYQAAANSTFRTEPQNPWSPSVPYLQNAPTLWRLVALVVMGIMSLSILRHLGQIVHGDPPQALLTKNALEGLLPPAHVYAPEPSYIDRRAELDHLQRKVNPVTMAPLQLPQAQRLEIEPGAHTLAGTLIRKQKAEEKERQTQRSMALEATIAQANNGIKAANRHASQVARELAALEKTLAEHKSVIDEIENVEKDLSEGHNQAARSEYLCRTNSEYKEHFTAFSALSKRKQELDSELEYARRQMEEARILRDRSNAELAKLSSKKPA